MPDATNLPEIPESSTAADPMRGTCGHRDGVLIAFADTSWCIPCAERLFGPVPVIVRNEKARRVRREKANS